MRSKMFIWMCFGVLVASSLYAQELTGREIADRAFQARRIAGVEATVTMTIMDSKGRERIRQIAQVSKITENGRVEKKLVRFLAPADVKGTGLLTYDYDKNDDDMWLFMPALRKTRRIISSEKAKSFMGSEFTYADMTPPALDDFTFTLKGSETVDGVDCYVIEMVPVNDDIADENGFSKRISRIAKKDFVMRKIEYYDLDGELEKELIAQDIREIDTVNHTYRAMYMHMTNVQNDRQSKLEVNEIQFSPGVKESYFTTRYLERE